MIAKLFRADDGHSSAHLLIILVVVGCVYGRSVAFDFVWDDEILLVGQEVYQNFELDRILFSLANRVEYQPIRDISYAVDYALWGNEPAGFHSTNLLLYFLNVVFAYLMTFRLASLLRPGEQPLTGRRAGEVALATALLFAVHPVHSEVVSFVSCRNVLLSGLFFFMSCHLFLRYLAGSGGSGWRSYAASLVCCVLAVLSKSTAVVLPGVLLLFAAFGGGGRRKTLLAVAPFIAVSVVAAIFFEGVAERTGVINPDEFITFGSWSVSARLAVAAQIPFFYLGKLALPSGLSALYAPGFSSDLGDPKVLLSAFALAAAVALGIRLRRRCPELSFALGWYLVALLPVLNLFVTSTTVADRYVYLSSYSFLFLVVSALFLASTRIPVIATRSVAAAAVIALSSMAFERNGVWSSDESLWEATVRTLPTAWKAHYNLGACYFSQGEYERAFEVLERLADLRGNDGALRLFKARYALQRGDHSQAIALLEGRSYGEEAPFQIPYLLGRAYEASGDLEAAIDHYAEALRIGSRAQHADLLVARERLSGLQSKVSRALEGQRRAVEENSSDLNSRARLAIALDRSGLYDEALRQYVELSRRGGANWSLYYNMGNVYRKLGRNEEAVESYEKSIAMNPNHPQTHNNMGVALKKLGEYDRAIDAFETGMRLDPDYANAPFNLATLYFRLGDREGAIEAFDRVVRSFPELQSQVNPYLEALK